MSAALRAVVFKTTKFKATKAFFETEPGLPVKEFSNQHFVVFSKGIRLVFLECNDDFEVDFYVNGKPNKESSKNDKMQVGILYQPQRPERHYHYCF